MSFEVGLVLAAQIISVLGLGGVLLWMGRTIKAMKGTVDTQKDTIAALRTFLDVADVPKMADRFKAYREIVDREKEALTATLEEERKKLSKGSERAFRDALDGVLTLVNVASDLLPYVPKNQRAAVVDALELEGHFDVIRVNLHDMANEAPDLSSLAHVSQLLTEFGESYRRAAIAEALRIPLPPETLPPASP